MQGYLQCLYGVISNVSGVHSVSVSQEEFKYSVHSTMGKGGRMGGAAAPPDFRVLHRI